MGTELEVRKEHQVEESQEETHDPETLPYYMDAVKEGRPGRWWDRPLYRQEDSEL